MLNLAEHIKIEQRVRYNVWDLLGDVGGFYDGLYLIGYFLMAAYSATSFNIDVL